MAKNRVLSLHLFYTESSISHLNNRDLYIHVQKTMRQLGIPQPAKAHVKKIGDGTVLIEQCSCHPPALKKLESAIAMAGSLQNTDIGLIAIDCPDYSSDKTRSQSQSLNPPEINPSNVPSETCKGDYSDTPEKRVLLSSTLESRMSGAVPHRVDDPKVPDTKPQPPSSSHKKASETPALQRPHPFVTLPLKPSWVTDNNAPSRFIRGVLKTEPMSPDIPALSKGDVGSPRAPEPSLKKRIMPKVDEGTFETRKLSLKHGDLGEANMDGGEPTVHKRRKLENGASLSRGSSERHVPAYLTNAEKERITPRTDEGTFESQKNSLKHGHREANGESGKTTVHKQRSRENGSSLSTHPSQRCAPDFVTNVEKSSAPSAASDVRLAEDWEGNMQSLRSNVSDLERRLLRETNEVDLLRQELNEERRKRVRAELIVEDIRREMKEPFIVPTLLEAFIAIADISNTCMEDLP